MYMYINKLGSRSYGYIHLKSSHICVIHLVLERCCFEAVLSKKRLRPLRVKFKSNFCGKNFSSILDVMKIWHAFLMQEGLVLECICNVKYGSFFTIARPFLDTKFFFHDFF